MATHTPPEKSTPPLLSFAAATTTESEMGDKETAAELPPHVLIFPLPMQGHVNSMLKLAELLCLSNLHVTMLLSTYNHGRLLRHANIESRFSRYPGFRVATITDGLPDDHPRVGERSMDIVMSLKKVGGGEFRRLMETTDALSDGGARRRVSVLIMDGVLSFAIPVVEEMGIPFIYFRTVGACSFWANFSFKEVIEAGEVPLKGTISIFLSLNLGKFSQLCYFTNLINLFRNLCYI